MNAKFILYLFSTLLFSTAVQAQKQATYQKELKKAEQRIEENPKDDAAYHNLANILFYDLEKDEEAERQYKKAIALNPKNAEVYKDYSELLKYYTRYDETIKMYHQILELQPNDTTTYYNLAEVFTIQKRDDKALPIYKKIDEMEPNEPTNLNNWGLSLHNLRRYSEAMEKYSVAIALNPIAPITYSNWGLTLNYLGRYTKATIKYKISVSQDASNSLTYENWDAVIDNLKKTKSPDYEKAAADFKSTLKKNKDLPTLKGDKFFQELLAKYGI